MLKFTFSEKATKIVKSSVPIWQYVVNVKSTVKISSIFVAFLENKNFMYSEQLNSGLSFSFGISYIFMFLCL